MMRLRRRGVCVLNIPCFLLFFLPLLLAEYVVDEESRLNFLRKLLDTLPGGYRIVLERVIGLLAIVSTHASVNKMNVHNLGIVFGPALMRRKMEDVKQVVQDSPVIIRIVRALIEDYTFFFKNGERSLKTGSSSPSSASETELVRRGTIGAGDPPPFPASLRAENIPIAVRMLADELTEAQEFLLKSSVAGIEGGGKANSGGGKEDSAIIAAQQEKFKALQNMVSSAFINIKHQLTYLSIQIEDRIKTMDDVMACYQLVKCLKQVSTFLSFLFPSSSSLPGLSISCVTLLLFCSN
jgi:hypothetical protein